MNEHSDQTTEPRDHLIRKGGYYYRPNRCGYVLDPFRAGRYTKSEAEREAAIEPWHMQAVPVALISALQDIVPSDLDFHLRCVTSALEQAQDCIHGETPEDCSPEDAARDVLDTVRAALLKHVPEIRKALANDK